VHADRRRDRAGATARAMNQTDPRYAKVQPIEDALAEGAPLWEKLGSLLPAAEQAAGAAGQHEKIYRGEAAYNLIVNHEAVLRDLVNPSTTHNIIGNPLTQTDLKRVPTEHAKLADAFLREVARRLIGRKDGVDALAEPPHKVWAACAMYVITRVHTSKEEVEGTSARDRGKDMSARPGMAFKAVMGELGNEALLL